MILVEQTLDHSNPREWYYALMDYGSHLSKIIKNPNRKSAHYIRQSTFKGSNREVRGALLKFAHAMGSILPKDIDLLPFEKEKIKKSIADLIHEGFLVKRGKRIIFK
jgi:A/G-specific adenine glycosylase